MRKWDRCGACGKSRKKKQWWDEEIDAWPILQIFKLLPSPTQKVSLSLWLVALEIAFLPRVAWYVAWVYKNQVNRAFRKDFE